MTSNKFNFKKVDMEYTGGGIYVMTGQMEDGRWFITDFESDYVAFVDDDPWANDGQGFYNEWLYDEGHVTEELGETADAMRFFKAALTWITENKPEGNYSMGDVEDELDYYTEVLNTRREMLTTPIEEDAEHDANVQMMVARLNDLLGTDSVSIEGNDIVVGDGGDYTLVCDNADEVFNTLQGMCDGILLYKNI